MLCKKGEIHTGPLSYYVQLQDMSEVLVRILNRLLEYGGVMGVQYLGGPDTRTNVDILRQQLIQIHQFITYNYRTHYVKVENDYRAHCCYFTLNKITLAAKNSRSAAICASCDQSDKYFENWIIFWFRPGSRYLQEMKRESKP